MKFYWLTIFSLALVFRSNGQAERMVLQPLAESFYLKETAKPIIAGLRPDPQTYYRYASPWMTFWPSTSPGQLYWLGSTTTQSFNNGKFGTIYFYDMLGNLQQARTFIDISGKNRRGWKLLLPTLSQRMFTQH